MTSVPNPSLDAGQRALKQGNYSVAIAHLEGVCETELDDSLVARASQELVRAYSSIVIPKKRSPFANSSLNTLNPISGSGPLIPWLT
jgi:cell division inhibitor SulA